VEWTSPVEPSTFWARAVRSAVAQGIKNCFAILVRIRILALRASSPIPVNHWVELWPPFNLYSEFLALRARGNLKSTKEAPIFVYRILGSRYRESISREFWGFSCRNYPLILWLYEIT
ncbi:hypothetical protein ABZ697_31830, partial [Streptomyces albidoflavus]|uniref:hypothetical protein n=1 Tax=Streptomyces albidoflavus TaxID=1886 RepID=UPI0033ECB603